MQIFTAFVWKIICNSAECKPWCLSECLQWKGGLRSLHRNVKTRSVHHWIKTRARSQPGQHFQSSSNSSNTFATVSKQLQQWKKRLLQYSAAGWNQIRLRCVSVPSSCSGGEVVARKFPEKISVNLFSESEQEAGQWVLPASCQRSYCSSKPISPPSPSPPKSRFEIGSQVLYTLGETLITQLLARMWTTNGSSKSSTNPSSNCTTTNCWKVLWYRGDDLGEPCVLTHKYLWNDILRRPCFFLFLCVYLLSILWKICAKTILSQGYLVEREDCDYLCELVSAKTQILN